MSKPLFIPLKTEYFDRFADGTKTYELRLYGPRWNEKTCAVGREVILSKGYGKQHRLRGQIFSFQKKNGTDFVSHDLKTAIMDVYGTLNVDIALIGIRDVRKV